MADQTKESLVFDDRILVLFEGNLKRIFAMRITRSTFRELQNVILSCTNKDKEMANLLFEILLTGQIKHKISNEKHRETLEDIIKYFTIPARLAKEVHERGEFVNIITSDLLTQADQFAFLNRIRRIDGEEFVFMSDTQNTLHILNHFVGRLSELEAAPKGKDELLKHKKELSMLADRLKQLTL
jgi:hypothetical protein